MFNEYNRLFCQNVFFTLSAAHSLVTRISNTCHCSIELHLYTFARFFVPSFRSSLIHTFIYLFVHSQGFGAGFITIYLFDAYTNVYINSSGEPVEDKFVIA